MNLNIILVSPPWFPLQLRNDLYSDDSHSQTRFLEESNYVRNAGETTKHRNKVLRYLPRIESLGSKTKFLSKINKCSIMGIFRSTLLIYYILLFAQKKKNERNIWTIIFNKYSNVFYWFLIRSIKFNSLKRDI